MLFFFLQMTHAVATRCLSVCVLWTTMHVSAVDSDRSGVDADESLLKTTPAHSLPEGIPPSG